MTTEDVSTSSTEASIQPVQDITPEKICNCSQDTASQPRESACLKSVAATNAKYLTFFYSKMARVLLAALIWSMIFDIPDIKEQALQIWTEFVTRKERPIYFNFGIRVVSSFVSIRSPLPLVFLQVLALISPFSQTGWRSFCQNHHKLCLSWH